MRFDVITIFPKIIETVINESIMKRALDKKKFLVKVHDLRDYTQDKHRKVDDRPFGGGPGMILSPQAIFDAVKSVRGRRKAKVILTCPKGKTLTQGMARQLVKSKNIIIICGHYEGVDERVRQKIVDESISIGDYVLTGGELPSLVLIDCLARFIPGVLGKQNSLIDESFETNLLEYPQYTRPANFRGIKIPPVLLSGNHRQIAQWRLEQARVITRKYRPDLLKK